MQTYQDTATSEVWAFEDDVIATETDGIWAFVAPDGTALATPATLVAYTPPPPPPPTPPTTIQAAAFLSRFTPTEQIAVQTAASSTPAIAFGLTLGLAQGYIILTSPILANWMAALVTAGAITSARATAIMTP